jgi:hypothetical protein
MTTILMVANATVAGVRHRAGDIVDLPADEAAKLIRMSSGVETVPSDPAARARWYADYRSRIEARAAEIDHSHRRCFLPDFRRFASWCHERGIQPLPVQPNDVRRYLLERLKGGVAWATARRDLYGIGAIHALTGHPPVAWVFTQGIWRDIEKGMTRAANAIGSNRFADQVAFLLAEMDEGETADAA